MINIECLNYLGVVTSDGGIMICFDEKAYEYCSKSYPISRLVKDFKTHRKEREQWGKVMNQNGGEVIDND